jgi:hypothetical protein
MADPFAFLEVKKKGISWRLSQARRESAGRNAEGRKALRESAGRKSQRRFGKEIRWRELSKAKAVAT